MRKICVLAFPLLIFLFSLNVASAASNAAFAKDIDLAEVSSDSADKINYELPYPGILPDSPLYFLRIIRDKTVGFLISDPKKKAEFNLLQADKRLNAGIHLFNKGKIPLADTTISKAENYFEEALQKTKKAYKEGMEITEIRNKLIDSSKKHQQVLMSLEKRSPKSFKKAFNFQLQRVVAFEKEVEALLLKIRNNTQ